MRFFLVRRKPLNCTNSWKQNAKVSSIIHNLEYNLFPQIKKCDVGDLVKVLIEDEFVLSC